jgi:peptidoglycan/xylan/chitin deacetylase (PgdA/CDA1 family)
MTSANLPDRLRQPQRDFRGYGRNAPRVRWPDGARVAVCVVVNYEAGAELSVAAGDERGESVGEFAAPISAQGPSVRDLCTESIFEYESRAGVWRLARILDEYEVKATFFACGVALELNPEVGAYIGEAEHEPCAHGWRWQPPSQLGRDEEREHMRLAIEAIERTCGSRPVGWFSRCTPSVHTRELVVAEGGFIYDSDAYNDDLPYFVDVGATRHLVVPYSLAYNDMRFVFPGFADPLSFFNYLQLALDQLWDEGAEAPKLMSIGLHPRWAGQAGRAAALRRFLHYARDKGGVWFARRADVARWWLDHHAEFAT